MAFVEGLLLFVVVETTFPWGKLFSSREFPFSSWNEENLSEGTALDLVAVLTAGELLVVGLVLAGHESFGHPKFPRKKEKHMLQPLHNIMLPDFSIVKEGKRKSFDKFSVVFAFLVCHMVCISCHEIQLAEFALLHRFFFYFRMWISPSFLVHCFKTRCWRNSKSSG